jgi:hypothetical protein
MEFRAITERAREIRSLYEPSSETLAESMTGHDSDRVAAALTRCA